MAEEEKETLELQEQLKDYKSKVATVTKARLDWDKDLIFVGRTQRGYEIEFDAKVEWGCMPTESLLLSLGGCLAIDVVSFLQKMRCQIEKFWMELEGERNPTPPQYYKAIKIVLHIKGEGLTDRKVQRAIELSQQKYCSVRHTLRADLQVSIEYRLNEE